MGSPPKVSIVKTKKTPEYFEILEAVRKTIKLIDGIEDK